MALNLQTLGLMIPMLLAAAFCLQLSTASRGPIIGGYQPIKNLNDPEVIEIAKFAVNQHNEEAKTELHFQKVIKGEVQVVSGLNYKLVIVANDGGASHQYEAVVWVKTWMKFRQLTSFTELN